MQQTSKARETFKPQILPAKRPPRNKMLSKPQLASGLSGLCSSPTVNSGSFVSLEIAPLWLQSLTWWPDVVQDATILIRDMASDSAQKAAGALKPSEEDLAQIDKPADESVWHESPNLSKEALKSRFKKEKSEKPQGSVDTVNGSHSINGANGVNGVNGVDGVATSQQAGTSGTADTAEVKDQATTTAKQRSKEAAERTKKFLSEKMPRERREQTIWRIKKMIVEIQGHADCKFQG